MSRISNERLAELRRYYSTIVGKTNAGTETALAELQQFRALVTELRALAERKSSAIDWMFAQGYDCALSELRSLLSAYAAEGSSVPQE